MDYGQYQRPVNGFTRVTGVEGAKAYQMPPNSSMPLFDGNQDVFYAKSTDGAGFPTIKAYEFHEIQLPQLMPQQGVQYVTRQELDAMSAKLDRIMEALDGKQPVLPAV